MADFEILENPFTPTFGEIPLHLAGRGTLLNELKRAYSGKKRHPSLTMAITGAHGTGKTALLAAAADEAEAAGWIAARATALPGMLDDILISTQREGSHLIDSPSAHLSSIEIGGAFSASWENPHRPTNWRNEITHLLNQLRDSETGLPNNILSLEKDKQVSFLRRSQKRRLARISDVEVEQAIRRTIEENGRSVSDEALQKMTKAANGFPFMIQLVGFHVWEASSSQEIDLQAACSGIKIAESELLENIVKVTYSELLPLLALFAKIRAMAKVIAHALGDRVLAEEIDLTLFYEIDGKETQVHKTNEPITVKITLPDSSDTSQARTYEIIRVHEGKADILPATFDTNTHELTFETDRFSAYAVVYKDLKDGSELGVSNTPNTPGTNDGDQPSATALATTGDTSLALFALLGALIAASCLVHSSIRRSRLEFKEGR